MLVMPQSHYIEMADGTRLAVSVWRADEDDAEKSVPAILISTRYWRLTDYTCDDVKLQFFAPIAKHLSVSGYILVVCDARGTGASFGCRLGEISPEEVQDIGETIDWISRQTWCDGNVGTMGTSYTANTALYSLITSPSALKIAVCRAPDFDIYRHLIAPGGIINHWFIEMWGKATAALDSNDIESLYSHSYWPKPACGIQHVIGVKRIDSDMNRSLLKQAVKEHRHNFNISESAHKNSFSDDRWLGEYRALWDPINKTAMKDTSVPLVIICGWHDAGTQLGAISLFSLFPNPIRIIIGPWNHGGEFIVDPFTDDIEPIKIPPLEVLNQTLKWMNKFLKGPLSDYKRCSFRAIEYFTLGQNCWKTTSVWPLPRTKMKRLYMAKNNRLVKTPPLSTEGFDDYIVDSSATTGTDNRWHAQTAYKAVKFPDRQEEDNKLLVYDSGYLKKDTEMTGHPVVSLWIKSSARESCFFVYLEAIDERGYVRLLTEGQLNGIHRHISDCDSPFPIFGPFHSFKKADARPLQAHETINITFDLFPISVLLRKGWRVRVAIAGSDKDTFGTKSKDKDISWRVFRDKFHTSYIDLPIIENNIK